MNNQWATFDDGSVAIVSLDKKELYGFGPNINLQLTGRLGSNVDGFKKIPFRLNPNEIIKGIYAGGSSCFGDNALFVLTVIPPGEIVALTSTQDRIYRYPLTRLSCCGSNLQHYFPNSASVAKQTGRFIEVPLPQTKFDAGDDFTNLSISEMSIHQNNIVLKIDTQYLASGLRNGTGKEFPLFLRDVILWANLPAIENYACAVPAVFGAELMDCYTQGLNFIAIDFPIQGDATPRIPEKCALGEFFMVVVTAKGKAYICGNNIRPAGGELVPALAESDLKATSKSKKWRTISARGHKLENVCNVVITDNSQVFIEDNEKRVINLSADFSLTTARVSPDPSMAFAVYKDNIILATNQDLHCWGKKISDFLAVRSQETLPLDRHASLQLASVGLCRELPAGYIIKDIYFAESFVYLLAESYAPVPVGRSVLVKPIADRMVLGFGVDLGLTAIPTGIKQLVTHEVSDA